MIKSWEERWERKDVDLPSLISFFFSIHMLCQKRDSPILFWCQESCFVDPFLSSPPFLLRFSLIFSSHFSLTTSQASSTSSSSSEVKKGKSTPVEKSDERRRETWEEPFAKLERRKRTTSSTTPSSIVCVFSHFLTACFRSEVDPCVPLRLRMMKRESGSLLIKYSSPEFLETLARDSSSSQ